MARDEVARRSMGLITGLPVKDHRELSRSIRGEQWREVEETVDSYCAAAAAVRIDMSGVAEIVRDAVGAGEGERVNSSSE